MASIIHVNQLSKSYGDVRAVQGVDLEVQSGEIFAMLGPNGAGKSTTVEILEGLRPRDGFFRGRITLTLRSATESANDVSGTRSFLDHAPR